MPPPSAHHSSELPALPPLSSHRFLLASSSASVAGSAKAPEAPRYAK